jgi:selenophosphate synthase
MNDWNGTTGMNETGPTIAEGADLTRCGCAGKTPLSRVVFPARERIATRLAGSSVRLGSDADAAVLPIGSNVKLNRAVNVVPLDGTVPKQPFGGQDDSNQRGRIWTLAAAFLGDDLADADRLGRALGDAYAGLDGSPITIGKGHAVQVSRASGGDLWLEHLRPTRPADADSSGVVAANVDVLHAFPTLSPATQARIAVLNACNDVHAVGTTADRTVRPLVVAPAASMPDSDRVTGWYREGVPEDVTVLPASVRTHERGEWLVGASATARANAASAKPPLPDDCAVLLTRPLGALACFSHGVVTDDDATRERGLAYLRRDTRNIAAALRKFRPDRDESFDSTEHVARVTDISGEGITGIARFATRTGRSLRLHRLPLLPGAEKAVMAWTVPDATVETSGPFAVVATPAVLDCVMERLAGVDGTAPARIGMLAADGPPVVDATSTDLSRVIETAARWPSEGDSDE